MKKILLVAIAAVLGFTACEKDEDTPTLSNLEILQAHKWQMISSFATVNGGDPIDTFEEELSDDYYEFKSDMTYVYSNGENRNASDPEFTIGTYTYDANEDIVKLSTSDIPVKITSCSLEKMVWEIKWIEQANDVVIVAEFLPLK